MFIHEIHKGLAALLLPVALLLASCGAHDRPLPPPQQSGELVVVSRQSPTTVYPDAEGALAGPDVDLVDAFAKELGVKVRWVWVERDRQLYERLDRGQAHMAAAALSPGEPALTLARFGTPFYSRHQVVAVRSRDDPLPYRVAQLAGLRGWVAADTPAARALDLLPHSVAGAVQHGDPAGLPMPCAASAMANSTMRWSIRCCWRACGTG